MNKPFTQGAHHIGLTVSKLEESANFFTSLLGWREVRRKEEYPAIFVSDGSILLTLWAVKSDSPVNFDRKSNIGLHHLALKVDSEQSLNSICEKFSENGVDVEFSPELVGQGPAKHMMCYDPSGIRVEFFWAGQ